eukprot:gene26138-29527_t
MESNVIAHTEDQAPFPPAQNNDTDWDELTPDTPQAVRDKFSVEWGYSSIGTPYIPSGAVVAYLESERSAKKVRYFDEFCKKLRENGDQSGENRHVTLRQELFENAESEHAFMVQHLSLDVLVMEIAEPDKISHEIFRIPFTHGYMKRVYFLFALHGHRIPPLRQYLKQFEDISAVLIEDNFLSDERCVYLQIPITYARASLLTNQINPVVPQPPAPPACSCWQWFCCKVLHRPVHP